MPTKNPTIVVARFRRRRYVAALVATFLVLGAIAGYWWVTRLTPVSTSDAVRRFAEEQSRASSPSSPQLVGRTSPKIAKTSAPKEQPVQTMSTPAGQGSGSHLWRAPPAAGVYVWLTDGFEEVAGLRRNFPPESQRIVTRAADASSWTNHHLYSEEHEEWFEASITNGLVLVTEIRINFVFGPFDRDLLIRFNPPMLFVPTRLELNDHWNGSWSGETYGTYTARTFDHSMIVLGNEEVETWANEYKIEMHGEVEGEQQLRAWISPKYQMTVREEYVVTGRISGEPGSYYGEWSMLLKSPSPRK